MASTVLVTGGAGYIGSHACVALLETGHDLVVVDNFCNSSPEALDRVRQITGSSFPVVEADIRDRNRLDAVFSEHAIDAVR